MKGLIENFPEVAKLVMDKCVVTSSNVTTTDPDYSVCIPRDYDVDDAMGMVTDHHHCTVVINACYSCDY